MELLRAVLFAVFLHVASSAADIPIYEVPQPLFEVFSPKGLRATIPDSRDVESVEFILSLPSLTEPLHKEIKQKNGSYWIYFNPDIVVNLYDKIQYKLIIIQRGSLWKKEGSHVVQKVVPLVTRSNDTDCSESRKVITIFPSVANNEDRQKGILTTGKSSSYKSAFSTQTKSDLKPITKTTTSTTSGTFYIKPSGIMEATGYKKGSSFDSTKREGEQWQHYESELTAEELENMKQLYGTGLHGFPLLTDKLFPSAAKMYEKSYMSSESKSFPETFHTITYGSSPLTAHQFHQTHKTHESSSVSHSKPVFQFHYTDSAGGGSYGSSHKSEKLYKAEPIQLPNPLPPQGTIIKATEYIREEHSVPVGEVSQVHVDREIHSGSAPQKLVQMSQSKEFSSHNQEIVKPVFTQVSHSAEYTSHNQEPVKPVFTQVSHTGEYTSQKQEFVKPAYTQVSHSGEFTTHNQEVVNPVYTQVSHSAEFTSHNQEPVKPVYAQVSHTGEFTTHNQEVVRPGYTQVITNGGKANQLEYNSGSVLTVGKQNYKSAQYLGNIFTSIKLNKVKSPQECTLVPGVDYTSAGGLRELEKYVYELSCLATLAESTMKEELALLKQKNAEYTRKLDMLEYEVKRLSGSCNCSK